MTTFQPDLKCTLLPRVRSLLHKIGRDSVASKPDDYLAARERTACRIAEREEDGLIAIVFGGVDCDMSRWDDRVAIVQAIPMVVEKWINDYMDGAEGAQWTRLASPSEAAELDPSSRDLVLEAFEDGHPHVVYL